MLPETHTHAVSSWFSLSQATGVIGEGRGERAVVGAGCSERERGGRRLERQRGVVVSGKPVRLAFRGVGGQRSCPGVASTGCDREDL